MQRPRRTSEFHEEPGTATKRQTRTQQRTTTVPASPAVNAPGTNQKYPKRQSRIAVPTRASSSDRGTISAAGQLGVPQPTSATRARGQTPQRTPLTKTPATSSRSLFTAEKQRPQGAGGGVVSLHNDKKWVQDQTQRISERLEELAIPGIAGDFFARPNALRTMSIKQFVTIFNFCLKSISGNRLTIGSNHVEDIVNVLQKLKYPYQVNKSWLKTPNAQHSFGNVIVLLDFLVGFVPPPSTADQQLLAFTFEEAVESTVTSYSKDSSAILRTPDVEFQAQLFRHAEEGFKLWDKQLEDDFEGMKQKTCDTLINKSCGLSGLTALDEELKQLRAEKHDLGGQRPAMPKEDMKLCQQMEEQLRQVTEKKLRLSENYARCEEELRKLQKKSAAAKDAIGRTQAEVAELQAIVGKQILSSEARNALVEELGQLRHIEKIQKRTIRDVQERNYHQEVLLSRAKMQLNEQIEKYNARVREICFTLMHPEPETLQLPHNATKADLNRVVPLLKALRAKIKDDTKRDAKLEAQLDANIGKMTAKISAALEQNKALTWELAKGQRTLALYEQQFAEGRAELAAKQQKLVEELEEVEQDTIKKRKTLETLAQLLAEMRVTNERTMSDIETIYHRYADLRDDFLDRYSESLAKNTAELVNVRRCVEENEKRVERLKEVIGGEEIDETPLKFD